jgi:4a-hydroxytetrahydrobiopterin dehydratase
MPLLPASEIETRLAALPGWKVEKDQLTKTFTVGSFVFGAIFISAIAQLAEAVNHHPDVSLHDYKNVTITLSTHDAGGLTEKDFDLALQIEHLPHKASA